MQMRMKMMMMRMVNDSHFDLLEIRLAFHII